MRRHSTETLMGLTKRELVEYVRIAEHNQEVAEEALNQQAENVKDWMPVVRCKDCKHYHPGTVYKEMKFCNRQKRGDNLPAHSRMRDDDFCSYGERREGE